MNNSQLIPPGYKQTEVGVIPEDWESTTVRDIASPVRNAIVGGPFGSDLVSNDYVEAGVPVLRGQNMGSRFVSGSFAFVTQTKAHSLEANLARPGDLVFTQRGTLGQVSLVPDQPYDRYLVSQSQMKLTVNRKAADPRFFYYVFSSAEQQKCIRLNTIQTGVPHINLGILRTIPVQRPTLAEQEAIAEALSDADALSESLEQLLGKKRQLKQGAMQELLTGKRRLPGFSGEWELKRLGELAELKNGYAFKSITYTTLGNFNVITISNVQDGYMDVSECNKIDVLPCDLQPYHRLGIGDVLISMTGNVGRVCRVNTPDCVLNQRVGKLVPANVDAPFLFLLLCQRRFLTAMAGKAKGGAQGNLSVRDITEFMLRLPPNKTEQTAIATILSDMDAEITALEAKLTKTRQVKQGMMQELLTGRIRLVESGK